jgi:hypothetical protein
MAHCLSPIAHRPSPTFYVTIVAELFPLVMVLRRVLTYYGAIVAEIVEKTKNEEVISGILTMERYLEIDLGYSIICSYKKYMEYLVNGNF